MPISRVNEENELRILQWFGHHLKGEAAPDWITAPVPYLKQRKGG